MKVFKTLLSALKRNIFSFSCLVLAVLVAVTGALSYAKYVSGDPADRFAGIGSFSVSASVDGVSGLSFTNTAFWSDTDEDKVALNALRALNFSVNNFETDENGNKKVSDVKLNYTLTFSSPKSFAEKLAVQVFDGNGNAVLPQIVISDLLSKAGGEYDTASSEDYNGTAAGELTFSVKKESDSLYTATSGKTVVTVEEYGKEISQTLLFRAWDCSSLTSETQKETEIEGGKILSPLEITYTENVTLYRISVSMEQFVLPAGEEATVSYTVKLAPTDMISDIYLGGTLVNVTATDSEGNPVDSEGIKEIYGGSGETYYIKSTSEATTETYYDNSNFTGNALSTKYTPMSPVTGSVITYEDGKTSTTVSTSDVKPVSGVETVETYEFSEGEINWGDYEIEGTEPTKANYKQNYIAVTRRNPDSFHTDFYIHKFNATRTGTQTVTYTHTKTTVTPTDGQKVEKQTEVTDVTEVKRLYGEGERILLNITRETETEYTGNFKVETETTVTECTRTYTQSGFIYRGYYEKYLENGGTELSYWKGAETLVEYENGEFTDKKYSVETMNVESESHTESEKTTNTSTDTNDTATSVKVTGYEYLQKKVEREYNYRAIVIDKAEQSQTDEEGKIQTVSFTKDAPLKLFDENGVQKYCIAQCYSKSYPFFVNVVFEQAQ